MDGASVTQLISAVASGNIYQPTDTWGQSRFIIWGCPRTPYIYFSEYNQRLELGVTLILFIIL